MEKSRDNPSMANGESQGEEGSYSRSTKRQISSPLCCICHLRIAELEKCKGRVVLRDDIVKD